MKVPPWCIQYTSVAEAGGNVGVPDGTIGLQEATT